MREAKMSRPMASGVVPGNGEMAAVGTQRDAKRALDSVALVADSATCLVRRAMNYLESDRQAALRCLHDVSRLLGADAQESDASALAVPSSFHPGGLARWQARRALAYIEENLGKKMGIPELATLVSLSNSHFSRAFKRSLGLSPMAYVVKRRVERAKLMMISTGEQLAEIALACGFTDQSHLNRSFRRMIGMSPGLWRRTSAEVDGIGAELSER
jgi:AraC family transcriptional regulator